mgnify:FL=1
MLDRIGKAWFDAKTFAEHMIGFSHDSVHVIAGVCLQFLFAALLRVSVRSLWPWSLVIALEVANEWADLHGEVWPDLAMQWGESAKDILLTMGLPTLILAIARFRPQLFGASAPSLPKEDEG